MRKTGLDPKKVIPYSPASTTNAKPFGTTTRHEGRRVIRWRSGRTTIQNSHVVESALECVYPTQLCGPRSVTPARKLVAASKKTNRSRKKTESFAPLGPAASGSFFCAHSVLCDLWTGWLVAGIQLLAGCGLHVKSCSSCTASDCGFPSLFCSLCSVLHFVFPPPRR